MICFQTRTKYFSSPGLQTGSGFIQPPMRWVPESLSPGVNRLRREADHLYPFSAEVKTTYRTSPILPLLQYQSFKFCSFIVLFYVRRWVDDTVLPLHVSSHLYLFRLLVIFGSSLMEKPRQIFISRVVVKAGISLFRRHKTMQSPALGHLHVWLDK
jgi:hypothetical protein